MKSKAKLLIAVWVVGGIIAAAIVINNKRKETFSAPADAESAAAKDTTGGWTAFRSSEQGFKVLLPATPTEEKGETEGIGYYTSNSKGGDGTMYFVYKATYPESVSFDQPEDNLKNGLNKMLQDIEGNELVASQPTTFNGQPALDFHVRNGAHGLEVKGKFIAVPAARATYNLFAVGKAGASDEEGLRRFLSSFELL